MEYRRFFIAIAVLLTLTGLLFASCEKEGEKANVPSGRDGRQSINLSTDLVLHYTFDEGASGEVIQPVVDHSEKNCDGVCEGSPSFVTDGHGGLALKLRKGDYVNIPVMACADSFNVSVSLWTKDFGQGALFTSDNGGTMVAPSLYVNSDDKMCYEFGDTPGYGWSTVTFSPTMTTFQSGGWHHFVVTAERESCQCKLYVDGVHVDTQEGEQMECYGTKMFIGGNGSNFFAAMSDPMLIDNVRIYQRVLNKNEVETLFKNRL